MPDVWQDVRALLPTWVSWFPLLYPLVFGPFAWLCTRLCIALAQRVEPATDPAHWTELTRRWFAPQLAARACLAAFAIVAGLVPLLHHGPLHRVALPLVVVPSVLSAVLGSGLACAALERRIYPELTLPVQLRAAVTWSLVANPHVIVAALAAACLPDRVTADNLWAFQLALFLLMVSVAGAGIGIGRLLGVVHAPSENTSRAIALAAERVGHTPAAVYTLDLARADVMRFPVLNALAFTPLTERTLDDDALCELAAQELANLAEPKRAQIVRLAIGFCTIAPLAVVRPLLEMFGLAALLGVLANLVLWSAFFLRIQRQPTLSPGGARALEKLHAANLKPVVLPELGESRPQFYDRLQAAGVTPDYPRPAPPRRGRSTFVVLLLASYTLVLPPYLVYALPPSDAALELQLGIDGGSAWTFQELANSALRRRHNDEAVSFYRASLALAPHSRRNASALVSTLLLDKRCLEARLELTRQLQDPRLARPCDRVHLEVLLRTLDCEKYASVTSPHPR